MVCPIYTKCFEAIKKKDVVNLRCNLCLLTDINYKDNDLTLLWVALLTRNRDIGILKILLEYSPDLSFCYCNQPPLHYCCESNLVDFVLTLLFNGADPNTRDGAGLTPLHYAVFNRNVELFTNLVGFGADLEIKDEEGYTPFEYFLIGTKSQFASSNEYKFCNLFLDYTITEKHIKLAERFNRLSICNAIVNSQLKSIDCLSLDETKV